MPAPDFSRRPLAVGLISSNLAKKGVADFFALAHLAKQSELPLEFYLVGPDSPDLERVMAEQGCPDNLHRRGYIDSVIELYRPLDIVLNLSHFEESFGRTILEAMAAGRAVMAYSHGALPELIGNDTCGSLVPLGDVQALFAQLAHWLEDVTVLTQTARAGCERAWTEYGDLGPALEVALKRLM
nr:glycosyltransferase family 4 protein [Gilvimarinus xylanilyticus]